MKGVAYIGLHVLVLEVERVFPDVDANERDVGCEMSLRLLFARKKEKKASTHRATDPGWALSQPPACHSP